MRLRFTDNLNGLYAIRLGFGSSTAEVYLYPCAERKSERADIGF